MRKVLIIGGTRFVGPPLIEKLLRNGDKVTVFCRGTNYGTQSASDITIIKGDREISANLGNISMRKYNLIYDMCCFSQKHADDLLRATQGNFDHLVFFSTAAVYKYPLIYPLFEDSELGEWPSFGNYGTRKAEVEHTYIDYALQNNKRLTIFRPVYLLGENNYFDRENYYFSRILKDQPILIPGNGSALIQFAFLKETVEAFFVCPQKQNNRIEILNIAGDEYISIKNLVKLCGEIAGKKPKLIYLNTEKHQLDEERFYDNLYPFPNVTLILNNDKIKNKYGIKFQNFRLGLHEIYNSWKVNWNRKVSKSVREKQILETLET